jgi:hypothetical protein
MANVVLPAIVRLWSSTMDTMYGAVGVGNCQLQEEYLLSCIPYMQQQSKSAAVDAEQSGARATETKGSQELLRKFLETVQVPFEQQWNVQTEVRNKRWPGISQAASLLSHLDKLGVRNPPPSHATILPPNAADADAILWETLPQPPTPIAHVAVPTTTITTTKKRNGTQRCTECNGKVRLCPDEKVLVCSRCGRDHGAVYRDGWVDRERAGWLERRFSYRRINHLRELLRQLQGQLRSSPREALLECVRVELEKRKYTGAAVANISPVVVREILQAKRLSCAYKYIAWFTHHFNPQYQPPYVRAEHVELIIYMFVLAEGAFVRVRDSVNAKRENMVSYPYACRQICALKPAELGQYSALFVPLKGRTPQRQQDQFWRAICAFRGWPFNPTPAGGGAGAIGPTQSLGAFMTTHQSSAASRAPKRMRERSSANDTAPAPAVPRDKIRTEMRAQVHAAQSDVERERQAQRTRPDNVEVNAWESAKTKRAKRNLVHASLFDSQQGSLRGFVSSGHCLGTAV